MSLKSYTNAIRKMIDQINNDEKMAVLLYIERALKEARYDWRVFAEDDEIRDDNKQVGQALAKLRDNQHSLDPEAQRILNDNFWDLVGE